MSIDPDDFEGKLVLIIGRGEQFILSRKSTFMVLNRAKFLFRSYDYFYEHRDNDGSICNCDVM